MMNQLKTIFAVLLCGFMAVHLYLSAQETNSNGATMRAAIDFGSGAIKIQMSVVDPVKNCIVGEPLLAKYVGIWLTEDVATHGRISDKKAEESFKILSDLKAEAEKVAAQAGDLSVQFTGIATAVFRKAENGNEMLKKFEEELGIQFRILSQDDEGMLGFMTAQAIFPEASEASLLAWDSGNGSFQMTVKQDDSYTVYQGPLGHGNVRVLLSKEIRNGPVLKDGEYGNPVMRDEAVELAAKIKLLLPPVPVWLEQRLNSEEMFVATFGDGESIFALTARAHMHLKGSKEPVREAVVSLEDVQNVIDTYIGSSDDALLSEGLHRKTVTCAIHLSALMQHFGIGAIHYKTSIGNTPGMLIAPELWEEALVN